MVQCAVFGCNNNNNKRLKRNKTPTNISFYIFPKDKDICAEWVKFCCRSDKFIIKNARICSDHFSESDKHWKLQHNLLNYSPSLSRKVKPNAIPSLNGPKVPAPISEREKKMEERKKREERLELVRKALFSPVLPESTESSECMNDVEEHENLDMNMSQECDLPATPQTSQEVEMYKSKLKLLEDEHEKLKSQLTEKEQGDHWAEVILKTLFTSSQIKKLRTKSGRVHWSAEDITQALTLHRMSPKAYKYLRNIMKLPLPGKSTLKNWASKIKCDPGIQKEVLLVLKSKVPTLVWNENLVTLSFDEMKVSETVCYDKLNDQILGPHKMVQVVMLRSLIGDWKQPIFYDFDTSMNLELFNSIVSKVYDAGFTVVSFVCDLGGSNRGFLNSLGINESKSFYPHPKNPDLKIFCFADVPHMIKLMRNHFIDKGFTINGKKLSVQIIEEFIRKKTMSEVTIAPKVGLPHITVTGTARQKVKLATQLFSNSVASGLQYLGKKSFLSTENWEECSLFFKLINDWFDIFNIRVKEHDSRNTKKAYGLALQSQTEIIRKTSAEIEKMVVGTAHSKLPFQKGILISNNSLIEMYNYLKEKYNVQYILTYRLNQDILENFFSQIRAIGRTYDHPTALEFKYRIKSQILGRNPQILSSGANVQVDDDQTLNMFSPVLSGDILSKYVDCLSNQIEEDDDDDKLLEDINNNGEVERISPEDLAEDLNSSGLEYLAGYLAFKGRHWGIENLGSPTGLDFDTTIPTWLNHVSNGGLCQPNWEFYEVVKRMNELFLKFHCNNVLKRQKNINEDLCKIISKEVKLDEKIVSLFVRTRVFIRIRQMNSELKLKSWKMKNKKALYKTVL